MELKDFVRITLEQIVEGVADAQESINARGGVLNPRSLDYYKDGQRSVFQHAMPQEVQFDVGLTSTDKSGSTEGIGVFLGSVSLGKKNNSAIENVAVTSVRFTVPLVLPAGVELAKSPY